MQVLIELKKKIIVTKEVENLIFINTVLNYTQWKCQHNSEREEKKMEYLVYFPLTRASSPQIAL